MKNRKGAIELSMGTIVVLVLAMTMLILGVIFIQQIFKSGTTAIKGIDQGVQDKIKDVFASPDKKLVIIPSTKETIKIEQGDSAGVGIGIKNIDDETATFTYTVTAEEIGSKSCATMTKEKAMKLIAIGISRSDQLVSGDYSDNNFVRYDIPKDAPLGCIMTFKVEVKKGTEFYDGTTYDIEIV